VRVYCEAQKYERDTHDEGRDAEEAAAGKVLDRGDVEEGTEKTDHTWYGERNVYRSSGVARIFIASLMESVLLKGTVHWRFTTRFDLRFDLQFVVCVVKTHLSNAFIPLR
jgi:hypothetical protein